MTSDREGTHHLPSPPVLMVGLEDAARMTTISTRKLRLMVAQHQVPYVRIGRRLAFSISELERWIETLTEWPENGPSGVGADG